MDDSEVAAGTPRTHEHRLRSLAAAASAHRLCDAFGHLSIRLDPERYLITPPRPLGSLGPDDRPVIVRLGADTLPPGAPLEAWIHTEIYRARPDAGGILRSQPRAVAQADAAGRPLLAVSGHAAMLGGPIPEERSARLVRDRAGGTALAEQLGTGRAIVLRGNGAVTVGASAEEALAAGWVLERTAELTIAAGDRARELPEAARGYWESLAPELLPRIAAYLEGAAAQP